MPALPDPGAARAWLDAERADRHARDEALGSAGGIALGLTEQALGRFRQTLHLWERVGDQDTPD